MQTLGADVAGAALMRSLLFVPGDSERKLARATTAGADALIVDLEDAVAASELPRARVLAREFVAAGEHPAIWVRINPIDTAEAGADLEAVLPARPAGIVLPKPRGVGEVGRLGAALTALEHEHGLQAGGTAILPIVTERPEALFHLHEYSARLPRLAALGWGAEDLAAALGATGARDAAGDWLPTYELARSLCLLAAAAAGVPALDTVYTDFRDTGGLARYAQRARRDGFRGMLAIHPDQVPVINEAFAPSAGEIEEARRIVALFESHPQAGTLDLDGRMIDRPHLLQARRILDLAAAAAAATRDTG